MNTQHPALPDHWVAFRLGHLGDVALATGVLEYCNTRFGWRFTFVTKAPWAPLFEGSPCVDTVICPEDNDLSFTGWLAFARRLAREHQGRGFLDLHGTPRSRIMAALWRGPVPRYRKMGLERRLFLGSKGGLCGPALRAANVPQRYCAAIENPPPAASALLPKIHIAPGERNEARQRLDVLFRSDSGPNFGPNSGHGVRPVALHPYAAHALKTWPPARWRELAALLDEKGIPWVGLGRNSGPSPFAGNPRDLSNILSIRQSCALLAECRALVSGDSGPIHLAAGVGTPVVALFGPTTREWGFFPAGAADTVLEQALPCRPCSLHGKKPCPIQGRCLAGLDMAAVLRAIELTADRG